LRQVVDLLRERFQIDRVVVVADRGMISQETVKTRGACATFRQAVSDKADGFPPSRRITLLYAMLISGDGFLSAGAPSRQTGRG
jgi:hypothetical protein